MRREQIVRWAVLGLVAATAAAQSRAPAFVAVAGPDAEILEIAERWELQGDGRVVRERRERIAVNSYVAINRLHGEDRVVWDPARDRVEVLFNRTVLPSGEVVEAPDNAVVEDLPPQVHRNPLWSRLRRTVVVHTALEPGAVIEWAYRLTSQGVPWLDAEVPLRQPDPVRSLEVAVDVPEAAPLAWRIAGDTSISPEERLGDGRRTLRFRWRDLPPLPDEPGSPPRGEMVPVLRVSTASAGAAQEELTRRVAAAGPLPAGAAAAVAAAVEGKVSFEERVLAVLEALRAAVNVSEDADIALVGTALAPLAEVWGRGWATPLELAAMGAAACRGVGVEATVGLVGAPGHDGAALAGFVGFQRPVVALADREGCLRLLDPVRPVAGGPLEEALRDRSVLMALPRPAAAPCPRNASPWQRAVRALLTVDEQGGIGGELELSVRGAAVPHAALVRDPAAVATQVAALVPGGTVSSHRTVALSRRGAALVVGVKGTLPEADTSGTRRFAVAAPPELAGESLPPAPVAARLTPILLGGPGEETVEVTLRLPAGWSVAALPVPAQVENPSGSVTVQAEAAPDGTVQVRRRLVLAKRTVPAEAAGEVRALLTAWRSPASVELLLTSPGGGSAAVAGTKGGGAR